MTSRGGQGTNHNPRQALELTGPSSAHDRRSIALQVALILDTQRYYSQRAFFRGHIIPIQAHGTVFL